MFLPLSLSFCHTLCCFINLGERVSLSNFDFDFDTSTPYIQYNTTIHTKESLSLSNHQEEKKKTQYKQYITTFTSSSHPAYVSLSIRPINNSALKVTQIVEIQKQQQNTHNKSMSNISIQRNFNKNVSHMSV